MKKGYIQLIISLVCMACTQDAKWEHLELQMQETISVLTPSIVRITLDFDTMVKPMIESVEIYFAPEDTLAESKYVKLTNADDFTTILSDFVPEHRYNISYWITPSYLQQKNYISSFITHCNALPEVITGLEDELTPVSAKLRGSVEKGMSGYPITEYGFYYSLLKTGEYERHKVKCGDNSEGCTFEATINTLRAGATYYYYAYATNINGIIYGDTLSFTLPRTY